MNGGCSHTWAECDLEGTGAAVFLHLVSLGVPVLSGLALDTTEERLASIHSALWQTQAHVLCPRLKAPLALSREFSLGTE